MLTVRPGMTDPASIVFSDEGDVLHGSSDPDLLYNQIIRPWKSRLALAYIDHRTFGTDLWLILLTVVAIASRPAALRALGNLIRRWQIDPLVVRMAARQEALVPYPPPVPLRSWNTICNQARRRHRLSLIAMSQFDLHRVARHLTRNLRCG